MVALLGKLQSLWRRYAAAKPAEGADKHPPVQPTSPEPEPSTDKTDGPSSIPSLHVVRPATRAQRLSADMGLLRGDMRTLESKLDAIKSRCDRFDQAIASTPSSPQQDLQPLLDDLKLLRQRLDDGQDHAEQITASLQTLTGSSEQLRATSSSIIERVQRQNDRITNADERIEELARRIEHLQFTLQDALGSMNTAQNELLEREAMRMRDLSGRIVGLYVIAAVALTVALATLLIVITRIGV